jgi:hypothetical protein
MAAAVVSEGNGLEESWNNPTSFTLDILNVANDW